MTITYNLGRLLSPLWGILAERRSEYRRLFFAGLLVTGLSVAAMPLVSDVAAWFAVAFAVGAGASAAATVASLFVVDFAPRPEWEPRIGWLQSFNGTGQVIGLLLAGIFSHSLFNVGLWVAAAFMIPGLIVGGMELPAGVAPVRSGSAGERSARMVQRLDFRALAAFPRASLGVLGFLRHSHYLGRAGWSALPRNLRTSFGRFLISWFTRGLATAAFFAYFPLLMQCGYSVTPSVTALVYAAAASVGITLFVLATRWSGRHGSGVVYRLGLILRIIGFALLLAMFYLPVTGKGDAALAGFALIVLAWPILSVACTGLAARLTAGSKGTAMGVFNASGALATVTGTFASGPLVRVLGYRVIPFLALGGLIAAPILGQRLGEPVPAPETP